MRSSWINQVDLYPVKIILINNRKGEEIGPEEKAVSRPQTEVEAVQQER